MDPSLPAQYMTWSSLGTLAGAAGAVVAVANTARKLVKIDHPVVPFLVSLLVVYGVAFKGQQLSGIEDWIIGFLNGCLLFCTATGANDTLVAVSPKPVEQAKAFGARPVKWLQPWLTRE